MSSIGKLFRCEKTARPEKQLLQSPPAIPRRTIIEPLPGALLVGHTLILLDGKKVDVVFNGWTLYISARRKRKRR